LIYKLHLLALAGVMIFEIHGNNPIMLQAHKRSIFNLPKKTFILF